MSKRGTDHIWQLVKYRANAAIYAKCRCKYHYCCSIDEVKEDGSRNPLHQIPTIFYPYCPICGAKKKWHTNEIKKINKYEFEDW